MAELEGPERGLQELRAIERRERLLSYPFYSAALGELKLRTGKRRVAREHFEAALLLARSPMERQFLRRRVAACEMEDATAQIPRDKVQKAKAR